MMCKMWNLFANSRVNKARFEAIYYSFLGTGFEGCGRQISGTVQSFFRRPQDGFLFPKKTTSEKGFKGLLETTRLVDDQNDL
jgi:hypothetical protein